MNKMLKFILVIGSMIVLLRPVAARGQYVGGSRPWPNQRIADSLARKADTTMVRALEARHAADSLLKADSLAAHAARIASRPDSSKFKGFQKFYTAGILDSLKPSATGSTSPDSFPFSYVIGRGTGGNENYSLADSSLLGLALDSAFTRLASTGGTIFIKGGTYAINKVDTLRSSTRTIAIKGEEGRTKIYLNINNYWIYDTLNVGKVWITGGIEFIGTANALGLIRTGTTAATSGDSLVIRNNIIRLFNNASATLFAQDTLTNGWLVEDNQIQNCTKTQFKGYSCIIRRNNVVGGTFGIESDFHNWIDGNQIAQADSAGIMIYAYRTGTGLSTERNIPSLLISNNSITWSDSSNYIGIELYQSGNTGVIDALTISDNTIGRVYLSTGWEVYNFYAGIYLNCSLPMAGQMRHNSIAGCTTYGIYFYGSQNMNGFLFHGNSVAGKGTGLYLYNDATNNGGGMCSGNFYRGLTTAINIAKGKAHVVAGELCKGCTAGLSDSGTNTVKTIGADGTYTVAGAP